MMDALIEGSEAAASQAAVEPSLPHTSPYYNPMTMRGSYLSLLNENLIYARYHLDCIELNGDQLCTYSLVVHLDKLTLAATKMDLQLKEIFKEMLLRYGLLSVEDYCI